MPTPIDSDPCDPNVWTAEVEILKLNLERLADLTKRLPNTFDAAAVRSAMGTLLLNQTRFQRAVHTYQTSLRYRLLGESPADTTG